MVYIGAGVIPENEVFADPSTWNDRAVWRQLLRGMAFTPDQVFLV